MSAPAPLPNGYIRPALPIIENKAGKKARFRQPTQVILKGPNSNIGRKWQVECEVEKDGTPTTIVIATLPEEVRNVAPNEVSDLPKFQKDRRLIYEANQKLEMAVHMGIKILC